MLYLGKLELYDIYEVFLKTHFTVICSHLHHLIMKHLSQKQTHCVHSKPCEETEEESVDSLLMSFVLYASSSYLHKNVKTKCSYVLLCAVLAVYVFRYLHVRYINEKEKNRGRNFVLLNRNETYLSNMGFSKKFLLLLLIMKEVIKEVKRYKSVKPTILIPPDDITYHIRGTAEKEDTKNRNDSKMDMDMEMIHRCIKELQTNGRIGTTHIPSLLSSVNNSVLTEPEFPFNFVSLELLKLLHHKLFVYPIHGQNQKPFPKKISMLEKDIFCIINYVLRKKKKQSCHILQNMNTTLFTVDIVIHRNHTDI